MDLERQGSAPPFITLGYRIRVQFVPQEHSRQRTVRFWLQDANGNEVMYSDGSLKANGVLNVSMSFYTRVTCVAV